MKNVTVKVITISSQLLVVTLFFDTCFFQVVLIIKI